MSTRITVDLPDPIYRRLETMARRKQRDITDVVADVVSRSVHPFPVDPNREAMLREAAAFRRIHAQLWRDYPHHYVAITQGKLVDHDADPVALLQRIRRDYPGQTILRRKVEPIADPVLRFRSPRISSYS